MSKFIILQRKNKTEIILFRELSGLDSTGVSIFIEQNKISHTA